MKSSQSILKMLKKTPPGWRRKCCTKLRGSYSNTVHPTLRDFPCRCSEVSLIKSLCCIHSDIYDIFFSCRIKISFPFLLTHLSTAFSITTLRTIFFGSPIWSCSLRSYFVKHYIQYNLHRHLLIHVSGLWKGVFQADILYIS